MSHVPFAIDSPLLPRLQAALDVEDKLVRGLEALGPLAGHAIALGDLPGDILRDRLAAAGIEGLRLPAAEPLVVDAADGSLDAVVTLWSGFRAIDDPRLRAADLREVDRVLRPHGRLLVVHDYGRDEVSALRDPAAPEYGAWSRRDGPFLAQGGFKVRVLHCFWTFESLDVARSFLADAFGGAGVAVGDRLKRPRLSWNVAIYHRWRGGVPPPEKAGLSSMAGSPATPVTLPR